MKRPFEILGEIVDEVRAMASAGQPVSALIEYLWALNPDISALVDYLGAAFWTDGSGPSLFMLKKDPSGAPEAAAAARQIDPVIEKNRSAWSAAGPYPDLMRRADRDAFRAVAKGTETIVVVRADSPRAAGRYVGRAGFAPAPADLVAVSRRTPPNEGLLAADPADPRLSRLLGLQRPPLDYDSYRAQLETAKLKVAGSDHGYVIRDAAGTAFHPSYEIQGVYTETGSDAWSETIRTELNRRLGVELVRSGPLDRLEDSRRNTGGGTQFDAPVIAFFPDGRALTRLDPESIRDFYLMHDIEFGGSD